MMIIYIYVGVLINKTICSGLNLAMANDIISIYIRLHKIKF